MVLISLRVADGGGSRKMAGIGLINRHTVGRGL